MSRRTAFFHQRFVAIFKRAASSTADITAGGVSPSVSALRKRSSRKVESAKSMRQPVETACGGEATVFKKQLRSVTAEAQRITEAAANWRAPASPQWCRHADIG